MRSNFRPQKGVGNRVLKERKKITTYLDADHFLSLKKVSEITQIPMGRLLDQALNDYLNTLGVQDEPATIPIDKEAMRKKLNREDKTGS